MEYLIALADFDSAISFKQFHQKVMHNFFNLNFKFLINKRDLEKKRYDSGRLDNFYNSLRLNSSTEQLNFLTNQLVTNLFSVLFVIIYAKA
jgi:2-hydroxy-3-keto-5-methylthiopentenyl-1-phosphate phosphatase